MRNCWSTRFILGVTVTAAGLLVGCGQTASDDGAVDMGAGGGATGGAGGTGGADEGGNAVGGTNEGGTVGGSDEGGTVVPFGGEGGEGGGGGAGGGEPPVSECGDDLPSADLNAQGEADGDSFTYMGQTGESDLTFGSCAPADMAGSEAVVKFTAPTAGFWRFTTEGTVWNSVLFALDDCQDGFTETHCNDNVSEGDESSSLFIEMTEGQVTYLFVDQVGEERVSAFTLNAERIEANKPVISELQAYYSDVTGAGGIRLKATDADMDVTAFRWGVFGADGMQIPLTMEQPEFQATFAEFAPFVVTEEADGSYSIEGSASPEGGFPALTKMSFQLGDANGMWSDVVEADVAPTDVMRMHGEACDIGRALDLCPAEDACLFPEGEGDAVCTTATPPVVEVSEAFYNPETNGFAIHLTGTDPESNLNFIRLQAYDMEDTEVYFGEMPGEITLGLYRARQGDGAFDARIVFFGNFQGLCFPDAQAFFDECAAEMRPEEECIEEANALLDTCNREKSATITRFHVTPVDGSLKAGEAFDVEVTPTPVGEPGGLCDVLQASGACPEPQVCGNFPGGEADDSCVEPDIVGCPESYAAVDLNADDMESPWSADGDSTMGGPNMSGGTCGGGGLNVVFSFTAPEAGNYNAQTSGLADMTDSLIYVRSSCGLYGDDVELGCNDDIDTEGGIYSSSVDFMAEAEQTVYIFVDSYEGQFPGEFTLTVSGP